MDTPIGEVIVRLGLLVLGFVTVLCWAFTGYTVLAAAL